MDRIRIVGGSKLNGTIAISGAKNAALPLMIAGLLTEETLVLDNVPRLADVAQLQRILGNHGVDIMSAGKRPGDREYQGQTLHISAADIIDTTAPYELVSRMRASFWVIGPLLARMRMAKVSLPGGCAIGTRPVDLLIMALEKLGADLTIDAGYVVAKAPGAAQAAGRFGDHIAGVDGEVSAEFFQRHDQEIHRPGADRAAARQRDFRHAHARQQRPDHPETGAHPRYQFVRRRRVDDIGGRNMQGLALILAVAGAFARGHDIDAVVAEDALQLRDVGKPRHVVEDQRLLGQQPGDHQRQCGILRARDGNGAVERASADNPNAVHPKTLYL